MENKTIGTLLALALGGVAVYIIFKVREARAEEEPAPAQPAPVIVQEVKPSKWEITAEQVCYRSGSLEFCIPNPVGGLFKREAQVVKEALEATL